MNKQTPTRTGADSGRCSKASHHPEEQDVLLEIVKPMVAAKPNQARDFPFIVANLQPEINQAAHVMFLLQQAGHLFTARHDRHQMTGGD